MIKEGLNSLDIIKVIEVEGKRYHIFSLRDAASKLGIDLKTMPSSLKILFENLLRSEDGINVKKEDFQGFIANKKYKNNEIAYHPARVLMQDFTGVPAIVDLAAMRDAALALKADPKSINPLIPVDLVIDHSIQVDKYGTSSAVKENIVLEMERNNERYQFLKWGQTAFNNFRVVPPGTGICHQVNIEYLAQVVWHKDINGKTYLYPDTLVGTDSHTTMVNALGVLGWGVGGIEAEAAMLGQPISMLIPDVVGCKLKGRLNEGVTATDLVLTVTHELRKKGVVNKFVEFYGDGLRALTLADRATVSNMAPEYGATCGFFPIDNETIKYLKLTGRNVHQIQIVEAYAKEQGLWYDINDVDFQDPKFDDYMEIDLASVVPTMAGPKRPQDKVALSMTPKNFISELKSLNKNPENIGKSFQDLSGKYSLQNGAVVIAAITSCTNTSNPFVLIGAGLLAKAAVKRGLKTKQWVKTSLAPGSRVVTDYLSLCGLDKYLDQLGFNLVGYGCTTCIGNSGPLLPEIEKIISENNLVVASVLSGNRNFEGRVHPLVRANYLASPMLCVAYALTGKIGVDFIEEPIGDDKNNMPVYLQDIWPTTSEINGVIDEILSSEIFIKQYKNVFEGDETWKDININKGMNYDWSPNSTYIKNPPYFKDIADDSNVSKDHSIDNARILAVFGDSITTDHISPAGNIAKISPAASYLQKQGVDYKDFNSYGARRGNHEVMMRGTFANTRVKNLILNSGKEGGYTLSPNKEEVSIYDAAMEYQKANVTLVIFAGQEYGTGSSRDWAAKGTYLLGVRAVIAESFERIHRSNLVGMGVLPLVFEEGIKTSDLKLTGDEVVTIKGLDIISPRKKLIAMITDSGGNVREIPLICRVDTETEIEYLKSGGILQYVLKKLAK